MVRTHHQHADVIPIGGSTTTSISSIESHKSTVTFQREMKDDSGYVKFEYVQRREDKSGSLSSPLSKDADHS